MNILPEKPTKSFAEIMADDQKMVKTTMRIPVDKWKEIKSFCLEHDKSLGQALLEGFELLRLASMPSESTDVKTSGGIET